MTVHHVDLYHCQRCGRVSSCEHDEQVPVCCGEIMSRAAANISYQNGKAAVGPVQDVIKKSHQLDSSK